MNVLFLSLLDFDSLNERNIYTDLLREFVKCGHNLYVISPAERRRQIETHIINENGVCILKLKIGNTQKTNLVEKGISTVLIGPSMVGAIKQYFSDVIFDLILYTTPPITFVSAVEYVKNRDRAKTYLLLKDIFPQNAVDLGMMKKKGSKAVLYRYFRMKEKRLYAISDMIGCMSQANVEYLVQHNSDVSYNKVVVCPNSIEVLDKSVKWDERKTIREKYGVPTDKTVFVYGGNLGRPQGIPFLIQCIEACQEFKEAYFLVVGDGTEYDRLNDFSETSRQANFKLMKRLPKDDYDTMVGACDVGMIFLDHRFTIPNFPSRLLSYMQAKLPVLACTDPSTDVGRVITRGGFGWWCESNDTDAFAICVRKAMDAPCEEMGRRAYAYLNENYSAEKAFRTIIGCQKDEDCNQ